MYEGESFYDFLDDSTFNYHPNNYNDLSVRVSIKGKYRISERDVPLELWYSPMVILVSFKIIGIEAL